MRFFSMDACLAMLGIAAAVLEDYEEDEGGADLCQSSHKWDIPQIDKFIN